MALHGKSGRWFQTLIDHFDLRSKDIVVKNVHLGRKKL